MGIDFITHSFKTAAQTDPSAKLYYNDFNIERCCNAKINATLAMLKTVLAAGAPVHGVGMQGQSRVGKSPSKREMKETMARFAELVDEVAFTEVDIRHKQLPVSAADREQQASDYVEVVGACLETPKCVGVTVWDFTDQVCFFCRFGGAVCLQRSLTVLGITYLVPSTRGFRASIRARARHFYLTRAWVKSRRIPPWRAYSRVWHQQVSEARRPPCLMSQRALRQEPLRRVCSWGARYQRQTAKPSCTS